MFGCSWWYLGAFQLTCKNQWNRFETKIIISPKSEPWNGRSVWLTVSRAVTREWRKMMNLESVSRGWIPESRNVLNWYNRSNANLFFWQENCIFSDSTESEWTLLYSLEGVIINMNHPIANGVRSCYVKEDIFARTEIFFIWQIPGTDHRWFMIYTCVKESLIRYEILLQFLNDCRKNIPDCLILKYINI